MPLFPFVHAAALSLAILSAQAEDLWGAKLAQAFRTLDAGRVAEASAVFEEVAEKAARDGDRRALAEARRGQGRVFLAKSESGPMQSAFAEALRLFEELGDLRGIGRLHSDLGYAAWKEAAFEQAKEEYTLAAEAFEKAGLRSEQAGALRNMTFGRMPIAERRTTLERALEIAHEGTDRRLEGLILHALGDTLSGMNEQQRALEYYEQALPLLDAAGDKAVRARLLTSFGRLHRLHGDPETARSYHQRALDLLKETTDRDAVRQAEDALAISLGELGRSEEAMQHAEAALHIAEESRPSLVSFQRRRVGQFALRAGQIDRAAALFEEVPTNDRGIEERHLGLAHIFSARGDPKAALGEVDAALLTIPTADWEGRLAAYRTRSWVNERAGHLPAAATDALAAVDVIEAVRGGLVLSDDYRVAFSDGYRGAYDNAVDRLFRSDRVKDAMEAAERGRARALLDLRLGRSRGESEGLAVPLPGDASPVNSNEALVSYWVTAKATYAWVTTGATGTRGFRISIDRAELELQIAKANALGAAAGASRGQTEAVFGGDPRPTLRGLHDRLIAPLRAALPKGRGARLLIIPDGALLGLSFAELLAKGGRYLVEDFTIQYAPSRSLLKRRSAAAGTGASMSSLLVSLSSGFPRTSGTRLDPLPGARKETDALARLLTSPSPVRLNDVEATESAVSKAMESASIVHLATHAVADSRHPAQSFIALRADTAHDGRLTAGEIMSLSLRADLVVLSACHGASGQVAGEGMLGLSRALLAAGAHALLASVRALPDDAAAEMLPRFYADWRRTGDAASALRTAQLEQLRRLRAGLVKVATPFGPVILPEHPSLWAGLVLIGER